MIMEPTWQESSSRQALTVETIVAITTILGIMLRTQDNAGAARVTMNRRAGLGLPRGRRIAQASIFRLA